METAKRKELIYEWKNRKVQMGIAAVTCTKTGDIFAVSAADTQNIFNRHRFELAGNTHRNKALQNLWNLYGADAFTFEVVRELKYKDTDDERTKRQNLKELFETYLAETPQAQKL